MVNTPLIRPYLWRGVCQGGRRLTSHEYLVGIISQLGRNRTTFCRRRWLEYQRELLVRYSQGDLNLDWNLVRLVFGWDPLMKGSVT